MFVVNFHVNYNMVTNYVLNVCDYLIHLQFHCFCVSLHYVTLICRPLGTASRNDTMIPIAKWKTFSKPMEDKEMGT